MKNNEDIHIVFATDNNYALHCAAAMSSVLLHTSAENKIVFHILDGGISAENKAKMQILPQTCLFEIRFYDMSKYDFSQFPLNREWISVATYYRLFLPDLLSDEINKVLYLDCDTICVTDIAEIYHTDIRNYYASAAEDIDGFTHIKRLNLPLENKYFNAGVMLFNLKKLRQLNFTELSLTYYKENEHKITMQDQDILNGVLNGHIKEIPLRWNINPVWQSYDNGHHYYSYSDRYSCL